MSEDSFVTTYNERTSFSGNCQQAVSDWFETCQKLHKEVTNLRKVNIDLESDLIEERQNKSMIERKCQRAIEDFENYKMKTLLEKNCLEEDAEGEMSVDYENVYCVNEDNLKKNLETEIRNCELESRCKCLENEREELAQKLVETELKWDNVRTEYDELRAFVGSIKTELMEINQLKLKISEMEKSQSEDVRSDSAIYSSFAKLDELQLKCHKLEKDNKKYKENHMNLLLLVEENTSLSSQVKALEEKLAQYSSNKGVVSLEKSMNNESTPSNNSQKSMKKSSMERKLRHLEKENEILKIQQCELVATNSEMSARIEGMKEKMDEMHHRDQEWQQISLRQSEQIFILEGHVSHIMKECESYKRLVSELSEQQFNSQDSSSVSDCIQLLGRLEELTRTVEEHESSARERTQRLAQLHSEAEARLEQWSDLMINANHQRDGCRTDTDQGTNRMVLELRERIVQLQDELENQTAIVERLTASGASLQHQANSVTEQGEHEDSIISTLRDPQCYKDMGFAGGSQQILCATAAADSINTSENVKHMAIFKKLTNQLLEAVKKITGFSLELGPYGHVSVQSCRSTDPSELLEFKVDPNDQSVALLDNSYSLSLKKQIGDCSHDYPSLLARIGLNLVTALTDPQQAGELQPMSCE